ncbi:hypothetical protein BY458DRAFT_579830 [Sporodiniella umbellata]|nr:hypothetical protein BY458DRAFT_579830 [Sporodiniella umbellata]
MTPSSSNTSFGTYSLFDFGPSSQLFSDCPDLDRKPSFFFTDHDFDTPNPTSFFSPQRTPQRQACAQCTLKQPLISLSCGHALCTSCHQNECPLCPKSAYVKPFLPNFYPCAKLKNIPWDASQNDIRHFFSHCRLPSSSTYAQPIHILMDRTTGKTLSDAYVEFATVADLWHAIETRQERSLKGRSITITECTQDELLSVVFPKWRGQFQNKLAIPPTQDVVKTMSTAAGGGSHSGCPPFITREEINSLLVVCKNYKLHFSRKCAERPFENIITVITKYPWHQPHLITTIHRDHIYELLKLSIESLKIHLSKDYIQIESTLLERLVFAGIICPAFTERQKTALLQIARIECPPQMASFLSIEPITGIVPKVEKPKGIPLLIHPFESKLSPWASVYSPSLWKLPPSSVESKLTSNSKTLAA